MRFQPTGEFGERFEGGVHPTLRGEEGDRQDDIGSQAHSVARGTRTMLENSCAKAQESCVPINPRFPAPREVCA